MFNYILRRLLLLPLTLFCIILINFVIINLAPGDPVSITEISPQGEAARRADQAMAFGTDDRYLQFREWYGLTLPILFNTWPSLSMEKVTQDLNLLLNRALMDVKSYDALRIDFGDQARFIMPKLLQVITDPQETLPRRRMASRFFVRGGTRQAYLGAQLAPEEKQYNRKIEKDNLFLSQQVIKDGDSPEVIQQKAERLAKWYRENKDVYQFEPTFWQRVKIFFMETRFFRYMSRVLTLDFGTLRNDDNKTVLYEVVKRFKYSLTLAIIPMIITFIFCQLFGLFMALQHGRWPDLTLNVLFLILFAIPVFVVAPFLIEKIALPGYFPMSGFTSPERIYSQETTLERIGDISRHIFLPLVAILYGSLAAQSRLSRTAFLEVMRQDYVRTARAKGVGTSALLFKHVGRNAAITIVTSLAGSLGIILGGSLIVETLFGINGFGKFFYDAIINRDYNVIMFSALAGSFLSLMGYLVADLAYTTLDPRVTLD